MSASAAVARSVNVAPPVRTLEADASDPSIFNYRLPDLVRVSFGSDRAVAIARGDTRIEGRKQ